jgi:hypothetical protein
MAAVVECIDGAESTLGIDEVCAEFAVRDGLGADNGALPLLGE